ncbi:Trafficking protein particle complex subunit BET5 [Malassezia sp. CBS 17886]|nr:Trafficking protein particle complex subunit BET5 [Malassezia sp. CBS 17886]
MALRVHSLWIFDRHCDVVYHQDWSHVHQAPASGANAPSSFTSSIGATLQRVGGGAGDSASRAASGASADAPVRVRAPRAPGASLPHVSRSVAAADDVVDAAARQQLPFDEEAKLIYGVVFSLRNLVRKVGGRDETFNNFSTSTYTLSQLQTPTMYTFVMITDPPPARSTSASSLLRGPLASFASTSPIPGTAGMTLRGVLTEIWRGPWIQYATRNPLIDATEREEYGTAATPTEGADAAPLASSTVGNVPRTRGIDNDALRAGIERVLVQYRLLPPTVSGG